MLGTVLVAPTAAGIRYDTVLGRYTTESCGGTYVGQESIPTMYDTLMKRVSVRNNLGVCPYVQYDTIPCVRSRECRYVRYNTWL